MEQIIPRETIRALARQAVEAGRSQHEANPYPQGTEAHGKFELDWQELACQRDAEVV